MPKVKLTDDFVENIEHDKSYSVDYYDKETGLILRVTPAGSKSFSYRYRWNNKTQRITIGKYPMYNVYDARQELRIIIADLKSKRNPKARSHFGKMNNIAYGTRYEDIKDDPLHKLSELIEKFKKRYYPELAETTTKSYDGYFRRNIIPEFGDRVVSDIERKEFIEFLDEIAYDDGHPTTANKLRNLLSKLYNWSIDKEYLDDNPLENISKYKTGGSRNRFFSEIEIGKLWNSIDELKFTPTVYYFKWLFLFGQRKSETLNAEWKHIDWENQTWTLPAENTKNSNTNILPLTEYSLNVLEGLRETTGDSKYLFESPRNNKQKPIQSVKRSVRSIKKSSEISDFYIHAIRHTVATHLIKLNVPQSIVGHILNHKGMAGEKDITAIYIHHAYMDEKREALHKWHQKLFSVI